MSKGWSRAAGAGSKSCLILCLNPIRSSLPLASGDLDQDLMNRLQLPLPPLFALYN